MAKGCAGVAVFFCVCLMLLCGAGALLVGNLPKPTPEQREASKKATAAYMEAAQRKRDVQTLITDNLKSPSTAKFDLVAGKDGENEIVVKGHVDSQNGFGAMVRSKIQALYVKGELRFLQLGDKILVDKISTQP